MAAQRLPEPITPEQYIAWESEAEYKSEYYDGVILAMAGASRDHIRIVRNITSSMRAQLRGSRCEDFPGEMLVRVPACSAYYYPDYTVVCGAQHTEQRRGLEVLLNPTLIVEVLSPSTERFDKGEKFDCYETLESLQMYVLVSQDKARVEVYTRQNDNSWRRNVWHGLSEAVPLDAVGCQVGMSEIYEGVTFPPVVSKGDALPPGEDSEDANT